MNNREICERLMGIRDNMIHGKDSANSMGELSCVLSATGNLICDLILDIASAKPEEPKNEPCAADNSLRNLSEKQYKIVWVGAIRYGLTEKQADELVEAIKQNERMKRMWEEIEKEEGK